MRVLFCLLLVAVGAVKDDVILPKCEFSFDIQLIVEGTSSAKPLKEFLDDKFVKSLFLGLDRYPDSRVGVSYFQDKPYNPVGAEDDVCYQVTQDFSEKQSDVLRGIEGIPFRGGAFSTSDKKELNLNDQSQALLAGWQSRTSNWRPAIWELPYGSPRRTNVLPVVVLITNSLPHQPQDGKRTTPKLPDMRTNDLTTSNDLQDDCLDVDYADVIDVLEKGLQDEVSFLILATDHDDATWWKTSIGSMHGNSSIVLPVWTLGNAEIVAANIMTFVDLVKVSACKRVLHEYVDYDGHGDHDDDHDDDHHTTTTTRRQTRAPSTFTRGTDLDQLVITRSTPSQRTSTTSKHTEQDPPECTFSFDINLLVEGTDAAHQVQRSVTKSFVEKVLDSLAQHNSEDSRMAVSYFQDKPYDPVGTPDDVCYKLTQDFTSDSNDILDGLSKIPFTGGSFFGDEDAKYNDHSQALLAAWQSRTASWRPVIWELPYGDPFRNNVLHVVILLSASLPHEPGDGQKTQPKLRTLRTNPLTTSNNLEDDCLTVDYADVRDVFIKGAESDVSFLILVEDKKDLHWWLEKAANVNTKSSVVLPVWMAFRDSDSIASYIKTFIELQKVAACQRLVHEYVYGDSAATSTPSTRSLTTTGHKHSTSSIAIGGKASPPDCKFSFDVQFLVEGTAGSTPDMLDSAFVKDILAGLKNYPGSRVAVSYFQDKPYDPVGAETDVCYKVTKDFSIDANALIEALNAIPYSGGSFAGDEDLRYNAQSQALLASWQSSAASWREPIWNRHYGDDDRTNVLQVVVLVTSSLPHDPKDGTTTTPRLPSMKVNSLKVSDDDDYDCLNVDYADIKDVLSKGVSAGVSFLILTEEHKDLSWWLSKTSGMSSEGSLVVSQWISAKQSNILASTVLSFAHLVQVNACSKVYREYVNDFSGTSSH